MSNMRSNSTSRHHSIIDGGLTGAHHTFWRIRDPPSHLPNELLQSACSHIVALSNQRCSTRYNGIRVPVDLAALIKCSDYFLALMRHVSSRVLQLPWNQLSFLESGFQAFVGFANGSELAVTDENAIDLYMTADFLICNDMRARVLEYFVRRFKSDLSIALHLLMKIDGLWLPELYEAAFEAVLVGFPTIVGPTRVSDEWLELTADLVRRVLSNDSLNCQSEEQVFIAAANWLRANPRSSSATMRLVECVRFNLMESEQRARLGLQHPALMRWAPPLWSRPMSNNSASDGGKSRRSAEAANTLTAHPSPPREPHELVLVFGGWGQSPTAPQTSAAGSTTGNANQEANSGPTGPQAACQVYNPRADSWTLHCPSGATTNRQQSGGHALPPSHIGQLGPRVYSGCLLVNGIIHVIGGYDGHRALRTVWRYNLRDPVSGWHIGSCMTHKRYYVCCAATEGGMMYAIGGHTGEIAIQGQEQLQRGPSMGRLSSVERLRPGESVWIEVASLRVIRSDAGAAAIGERVFVAGGFDGVHYHDSAEVYDPSADQWTILGRMCHPRSGVALVAIGDAVYAVGGNDGAKRLRSIEKYQLDGPADEWEEVGQMLQAKSNLSAVVLDGGTRILSIGGWSDAGQPGVLATSETFCPCSGESKRTADAGFAASATAACVVRDRRLAQQLLQQIPLQTN